MDSDKIQYEEALATSVTQIGLKVRTSNSLESAGIRTIGHLLKSPRSKLMMLPNFGEKSLVECLAALRKAGFKVIVREKPKKPPKKIKATLVNLKYVKGLPKSTVNALAKADIKIVDDVIDTPISELIAILDSGQYVSLCNIIKKNLGVSVVAAKNL